MSKKVIRLTESELKRYIQKIISEQTEPNPYSPELSADDKKGEYVQSGSGGGNDANSWNLSRKQGDEEHRNKMQNYEVVSVFIEIMKKIQNDPANKEYKLTNYEGNSQFSHIMVFRRPYVEVPRFDRFMILYTHKYEAPNALYGKSYIKIGYTTDKGEHNMVTNTYSYPFNMNKIVSDFTHMTVREGASTRVDIKDVKGIKTGQYGDFVPRRRPTNIK